MRIEGWRVDGFGILAGFEVGGIGAGLTVVLGPNESGKTTLVDFLRGVLVGFPDARRRAPRHEPVNGGRHGGAVHLVDELGRRLVLERHVGVRAPVATTRGPGSAEATGELLARLGSVDGAVYRSVFAFGLGELQGLGSLAGDELKDLLFSAGVMGAGRSATAAVRTLGEDRAKIVRARHAEARANRILRNLQEVERALRTARDEARRYPAHVRELDDLAADVATARAELDEARQEQHRLERITSVWPVWRRAEEARSELACTPADPVGDGVIALADRATRLAAQLSGYEARAERLDELERSRLGLVDRLAEQQERLGTEWDEERARAVDASIAALDAVRSHGRTIAQATDAVAFQSGRARDAGVAHDAAASRRDALLAGDRPPRTAGEIERGRRLLRTARTLLAEHERRGATIADPPPRPAPAPQRRLLPALAITAALVAGAACLAALTHHWALALAGASALVTLAAAWLVIERRPSRRPERRHSGGRSGGNAVRPSPEAAPDPDRPEVRLRDLAGRLGLGWPVVADVLDEAEADLDGEWHERARLDEAERATGEALAILRRERSALATAQAVLVAARDTWSNWTSAHGLPVTSPEAAAEMLAAAAALVGRSDALRRVDGEAERLTATVREFERRVDDLARTAGVGAIAGGRRDAAVVLAEVRRRVESAQAVLDRHDTLVATVAACDQQLHELLGAGPDAEACRAALGGGDVAGWSAEHEALAPRLAELASLHETAVRAHQDAARLVEALGASDDVARLELERAGLEEELRVELREWWILGLAKALIDETLGRYERERQPAVVARAAQLFAIVTSGRYQHLVPRGDRDGSRDQGIDVVDWAGRRLDATVLSRGTVEQLYLCLRLALAEVFAERAVPLPFVLDDVLVNFDPARAEAVVRVLLDVASRHQVLLFTCHPHVARLVTGASRDVGLVELEAPPAPAGPATPGRLERADSLLG